MQYKMSKEHKKNYLLGLRCGEYEQISGNYYEGYNGDMPCVCAVGLYLHQINGDKEVERASNDNDMSSLDFGWMIREDDGDSLIDDIVSLNDDDAYTFEQIADWVEEHVEGV